MFDPKIIYLPQSNITGPPPTTIAPVIGNFIYGFDYLVSILYRSQKATPLRLNGKLDGGVIIPLAAMPMIVDTGVGHSLPGRKP